MRVFMEFNINMGLGLNIDEWTLLNQALFDGNIEVIQALLKHGRDLMDQAVHDQLALFNSAILGRHVDAIRVLQEYGADVTFRNSDGWTLLHSASTVGHVEISWGHLAESHASQKDSVTSNLATSMAVAVVTSLFFEVSEKFT